MTEVTGQLKSLMDSIPTALALMHGVRDADGRVVDLQWDHINDAGAKQLLMPREALIGQRLLEKLPEHRDGLFPMYAKVIETGESFEIVDAGYDDTWGTQEVIPRVFDICASRVGDNGIFIWWADTTEMVVARRETQRLEQSLERRNAELQQFAYVASHDLQAPLRTVSAFAQLLRASFSADQLSDEQREYFDDIDSGITAMRRLISELLSFSRASEADLEVDPVAVRSIVDSVLAAVRSDLDEIDAQVRIEVPAELLTHANPTLLGQALQNLVTNSIKYRHPQRQLQLDIRAHSTFEALTIEVADNGVGIDPAFHERAFAMFQRLQNAEEGTGLGLALVRRIMGRFNGTAEIDSDGTSGTTVTLTLPVHQDLG